MKFNSILAFEKHLKESYPEHLSKVYIVCMPDAFERSKFIKKILNLLQKQDSLSAPQFFDASKCDYSFLKETLFTCSMFGRLTLLGCDHVDKLKKEDFLRLEKDLSLLNDSQHVVLGLSDSKSLSDKTKKNYIILDLSEEKPWEKKKRLESWLNHLFIFHKKKVDPKLIDWLVSSFNQDRQAIESECEKIISYCWDLDQIRLEDIRLISSKDRELSQWEQAEQLVWFGVATQSLVFEEVGDVLSFLHPIRYQLQIGLYITFNGSSSFLDIQQKYPQIKENILRQRIASAHSKGGRFFNRNLNQLFLLERQLKTLFVDHQVLIDFFIAHLCGKHV